MALRFRRPLIAGNWKMNRPLSEAIPLLKRLRDRLFTVRDATIVLCPPHIALPAAAEILEKSSLHLGAQNMCWEREGAFTGEISPTMLRDLHVDYVILGHSERRNYFQETAEQIRWKVRAALANGLIPILCVGESEEERTAGRQDTVVEAQLLSAIGGISAAQLRSVVIAYEPIWAIGTGKTATSAVAQQMHAHIRRILRSAFGGEVAEGISLLYGGSMKASNAADLLAQPDIDGGLIGGASLDVEQFSAIVELASRGSK
jgi:triosephosphate isomerase